ncbi:hypothetical protein FQA39_LY00637 [Lamprigera yunnana]|nr:hypothetical protein FQA39_LY00637 [Lamprigera yunnana]
MRIIIGNRDQVGYGFKGIPAYADITVFPFPALRWKENTSEVLALREKEKGDWRLLSLSEKKCIYRNNFCQTISEVNAPTGQWKQTIGMSFILISVGIWLFILTHMFVFSQVELPITMTEEGRAAQLRRMLDIRCNPVYGLSSKWDYERNTWK